jgi:hypothetical protein
MNEVLRLFHLRGVGWPGCLYRIGSTLSDNISRGFRSPGTGAEFHRFTDIDLCRFGSAHMANLGLSDPGESVRLHLEPVGNIHSFFDLLANRFEVPVLRF